MGNIDPYGAPECIDVLRRQPSVDRVEVGIMGKVQERLHRLRYWHPGKGACSHMDQIRQVIPSADGCEECLALGDTWVHLRMCLICGHVGCCDNSKNRHASVHFHETSHPIIQSHEPGEDWRWCYVDERMV